MLTHRQIALWEEVEVILVIVNLLFLLEWVNHKATRRKKRLEFQLNFIKSTISLNLRQSFIVPSSRAPFTKTHSDCKSIMAIARRGFSDHWKLRDCHGNQVKHPFSPRLMKMPFHLLWHFPKANIIILRLAAGGMGRREKRAKSHTCGAPSRSQIARPP